MSDAFVELSDAEAQIVRLTGKHRYWKQRHGIFSLYDHGIWTTDDSWFEVTHESIAQYVGLYRCPKSLTVR